MPKRKSYYRRSDGLYETSRTINGKRIMFRAKTCREVDRKILEYQEKQAKGRTFKEVAYEWYEEKSKEISHTTARTYSRGLDLAVAHFGKTYIRDITPRDVKAYIHDFEMKGYAKGTVHLIKVVLSQIFSHAVVRCDIDISPATEVRLSRNLPVKKRRALTVEQERVVQGYRGDNWLLGMMLLYTGCRKGELLALQWQDIDREAGTITINKKISWQYGKAVLEHHLKSDNGERVIPLLAPLAAVLPRNRIGVIFSAEDGTHLNEYPAQKMLNKYFKDTGLEGVTAHSFRHSFATICYEAGLDPKSAAALLGDTEAITQSVYQELRQHHHLRGVDLLNTYLAAREEQTQQA